LTEIVDTLGRAIGIIEAEMKGGASMMQLKSATSITQALSIMVQASMINTEDATKLVALVQSSHESGDGDEDVNAPAGAVYTSHSGDILATLSGLFEKAQGQLSELRSTETTNLYDFQLLAQSITDELAYGNKEKDDKACWAGDLHGCVQATDPVACHLSDGANVNGVWCGARHCGEDGCKGSGHNTSKNLALQCENGGVLNTNGNVCSREKVCCCGPFNSGTYCQD